MCVSLISIKIQTVTRVSHFYIKKKFVFTIVIIIIVININCFFIFFFFFFNNVCKELCAYFAIVKVIKKMKKNIYQLFNNDIGNTAARRTICLLTFNN